MNDRDRTHLSKLLSLVLRHEPERIGLTLDPAGWTNIETLLTHARAHGVKIDRATLDEVVSKNEKKRFAISEDGQSIRASQGHSVEVTLGYVSQTPPPELYHGTATRFLDSIRREGLRKGERHHVHLSADEQTAEQVGRRHGRPAVLVIDAAAMHARGHDFFLSENGVWLTPQVPIEFIRFPAET